MLQIKTPLMLAAEHGNKDICEMFIKKGALAQMTDRLGRSAGWYALDNGHSNIKYIVDNAPAAASWDVGADEVTLKQPEHVDFVDAFISSQNRLEGGDSTEDEGGHDNESDEDNTMLNQLNKDTKNTKHSSVSKNIPEPINSGQQRASTQMTMDLYRELEEEHDLLNQEYNQLTVKYNKLVQKQQQKEGQGQQQNAIDATLIESLEEEVQRLTSQLTQAKDREQEYVEEIQGLKDQLSAFQASDVEKEGSDVDSWGDTDDELFDLPGTDKRQPGTITQKLPKSTLSSEDQQNKKQIAVLRSQLLELTRDNDALKEKMSKMKPMSDSSEPVSLSKSEDERETVPLSQYEDLKRANESEVRDLKHKIAELESEKLTFITAIETTVPEEKYEEMQTSSELQIADMQGIISGLEKELERVNGQMSSNQQSSKTLEEHLQQKSLEVMTLQNEIVNLEAKISQLKQTGSPREGKQLEDTYGMEIAKLKQCISESEIKIQTLEQARENTIPNDLYKEMKKKNNEEKQVLQSQIDTLQEQLESVAKELNELTVHTDKLMSEKEGLAGKNKTLTQEVEKLQLQLENLQQYHEKTHTERETRLKQAGELTCELGRIQDTISHMSTENTQLKDTVQQQVEEIVELKDQLEKKVWYERQLMDQLAALKKENSHLKELELEKENFVAEMTNLKHHVAELEKENSQVRELIDENEKLFSENARLKQQKKTENKKDSQLTVDVKTKIEKLTYDNAQLKQQVTASNKESSKLKRDICSLNETVEKLNKALSRHQEQRSPSQSASGDGKQLQAMQNQIEKLKQQLAEADVKHREVVNTYRTHLLSAVQGRMDPDVQEALHHIISLRSKEQFC
ncbi:uveal autoantigen with coiled-coil domains and ankyrin repeats isoform X2 [Lingula anatina]|uniref:Uveal autoantigen with coiled-coil domains and ankyrin repeats isoform X2 n=1 Tax=Lingula anatina TaxID=7574 RepID=A0A1S3HJC7_LINAN|nr:uveal autoantigen with coiled-coil domains and ankyrin repeats isoform X2 [Lingula anatina]|eukprot:XP_013385089.1 uveal autoantigen with coiled-coil domains and ankyrin repeats isoform X2 [Lingula anatina]